MRKVLNYFTRHTHTIFALLLLAWAIMYAMSKMGDCPADYYISTLNDAAKIHSKIDSCYRANAEFRRIVPSEQTFDTVASPAGNGKCHYYACYYLKGCKKIIDFMYYPKDNPSDGDEPMVRVLNIRDDRSVDKIVEWDEPRDFHAIAIFNALAEFGKDLLQDDSGITSHRRAIFSIVMMFFIEYKMLMLELIVGLWTACAVVKHYRGRNLRKQESGNILEGKHAETRAKRVALRKVSLFMLRHSNLFAFLLLAWILLFMLSKMGGYEMDYEVSAFNYDTILHSKIDSCYRANAEFRRIVPSGQTFDSVAYYDNSGTYYYYSAVYYLKNCKKAIEFLYYPQGGKSPYGKSKIRLSRITDGKHEDRIVEWRDHRDFSAVTICKALGEFDRELLHDSHCKIAYSQESSNCISYFMMYFIEYKLQLLALIVALLLTLEICRIYQKRTYYGRS